MTVEAQHECYKERIADWELIRDVLAGERTIKAAATAYLPMLSDQTTDEYEAYKKRASFFNATKRTLRGLAGMILRRAIEVDVGEGDNLRQGLETITHDGQSFDLFCRKVIRDVISHGRAGCLVDVDGDGGEPYLAFYQAEAITNWRLITINGREQPIQIVLAETAAAPGDDEFEIKIEPTFRVLELIVDPSAGSDMASRFYQQSIWKKRRSEDGGAERWVKTDTIIPLFKGKSLSYIPFVFIGADDLSAEPSEPPLLDVATLNIHHYQRSADLAHGQHHTAIPTYWAVSPSQGEEVRYVAGPNRVWMVEVPNGAGILEFHGQGLTFLENACQDLSLQMASLGARLSGQPRRTAAEASEVHELRTKGEQTTLYEIVNVAEAGLTKALQLWTYWAGGNPDDVSVRLNRDFIDQKLEYRDLLMLERLYQGRVISFETLLRSLFEGDVLPSTFTAEDVKREGQSPPPLPQQPPG